MISVAKFAASLNDVEHLLKRLQFSPERVHQPKYKNLAATVRPLLYYEQWQYCYKRRLYDFKIFDSSLLQFQREPTLSYAFIESPFDIPSFEAFAAGQGPSRQEDSVTLRADYDLYVSSLEPRTVTPLRFDYDSAAYREGIHPAAHVHAGHRSNVRLATERVLSPMSFVLFVLRQCYPDHWEKFRLSEAMKKCRGEVRTNLLKVAPEFRNLGDLDEMYFV